MPQVTLKDGKLNLIRNSEERWKRDFRRLLLSGPPNSGKTTSTLTFPAPRHIIIVPGELGHSSIIEDGTDTFKYFWEINEQIDRDKATKLIHQIKLVISNILQQEKVATVALDGVHVLYQLILNSLGWPNDETNFGEKAFGKGHNYARNEFCDIIRSLSLSKAEHFVATCYDGNESREKGVIELYPDLPGAMAKGVMGLFPCVFHTKVISDGAVAKYKWEIQAIGDVKGVGIHLPKQLKEKFPLSVDADWRCIEKLIDEAALASRKQL